MEAMTLSAQQLQETYPGAVPTGTYMAGGIDNVGIFNGDPNVAIPLGPAYPLSGGQTYQMVLHYSNKFWNYSTCPGSSSVSNAVLLGPPFVGAGWTLALGHVRHSPTTYYSPDGGRHPVVSERTTDGSYLRVKFFSSPNRYEVEFPDGTKHIFKQQFNRPNFPPSPDFTDDPFGQGSGTIYGLSEVKDARDLLVLRVNYDGSQLWRVESIEVRPDESGPVINPVWTTTPSMSCSGGPSGVVFPVIDYIDFPTVGNRTLKVDFTYKTSACFARNGYDTSSSGGPCNAFDNVAAPLLQTVTFSDASGSFSSFSYSFTYLETTSQSPAPNSEDGALVSITLPTGGTIAYQYSRTVNLVSSDPETALAGIEEPSLPPQPGDPPQLFQLDRSAAVSKRTESDNLYTPQLTSEVTFTRSDTLQGLPGQRDPTNGARKVVVVSPSGNASPAPDKFATRYVFRVALEPTDRSGGIELVRRYYDNATATGTPIRSIVNCHEGNLGPTVAGACGYRDESGDIVGYSTNLSNWRRSKNVIWYGANPNGGEDCSGTNPPCTATAFSGWNNDAGKYATGVITTTTQAMAGWTGRTTTTNWTPQTGNEWLLNIFDSQTVQDSGTIPAPSSIQTDFTFRLADGFLEKTTVNDGANGKLEATYSDAGSPGNPATRQLKGTSGLSGTFIDTQTFQSGLPLTSQRTGLTWQSLDVSRDSRTGLVTSSRDANDLQTSYTYDALGRVETVTPPGEQTIRYCYFNAASGQAAVVLVKRGYALPPAVCSMDETRPGTGFEGDRTIEGSVLDGFGRTVRQMRRLPHLIPDLPEATDETYFARQEIRFNGAGLVSLVSEWSHCPQITSPSVVPTTSIENCTKQPLAAVTLPKTTWSGFDPFGRAGLITAPDAQTTSISYFDPTGSITHSDTVQAVTQTIDGAPATKRTRWDVLGRVLGVAEATIGQDSDETRYLYNALDRVALVTHGAQLTQGFQTREFVWDRFGFLRSEKHPEKKQTGQQSNQPETAYTNYNALGRPSTRTEAGLAYANTWDNAGRLTRLDAGGAKLLVHCFDGATCVDGSPGWVSTNGLGRLTRRYGYNYIPTKSAITDDRFGYAGVGGRMSQLITLVGNGDVSLKAPSGDESLATQNWTFNMLGLVATHEHRLGSFKITNNYESGFLTKITTIQPTATPVSAVTYNAEGGPASWKAGNNHTTTIAPSAILARPLSFTTKNSGGAIRWQTGDYAYDVASNVLSIGGTAQVFDYDPRSRLTKADFGTPERSFSYDRFGNLDLDGTGVSYATDPTTNQITAWAGQAVTHDLRGNLTNIGSSRILWYDALNRQVRESGSGYEWTYLYGGSDERLVKFPSGSVLRREMARLIAEANVKAGRWTMPSSCVQHFADVPCSPTEDTDAKYVQLLKENLVTSGCQVNPPPALFCPNDTVNRAQMAVFLALSYHTAGELSLVPPATGIFADVSPSGPWSAYAKWIEELYRDGVTGGCGGGNFCPGNPVSSWEMMVFTAAARHPVGASPLWAAYNPVPRGSVFTLRDEGRRIMWEGDATTSGPAAGTLFVRRDNVYLGSLLVGSHVWSGESPTGWYYFGSDHLGTPRFTMFPNGTWQEKKYWPYGEEFSGTGSSQRVRFAGMELDPEGTSTRYYVHARHYELNLSRFLTVDPIYGRLEEPLSWNRYAYVLGNPMKWVDPLGLTNCSVNGWCETIVVNSTPIGPSPIGPSDTWRIWGLGGGIGPSPWRLGWEWLTGTGPRDRNLQDGDSMTELLKQHRHIEQVVKDVCSGELNPEGSANYDLSGVAGIPKYLHDYSTLLTGGAIGNLAVTYLGSYRLDYSLGNGTVNMTVRNRSSAASGLRPPVLGYTDLWSRHIGGPLNNLLSSGPMSQTTQTFNFSSPCSN